MKLVLWKTALIIFLIFAVAIGMMDEVRGAWWGPMFRLLPGAELEDDPSGGVRIGNAYVKLGLFELYGRLLSVIRGGSC